VLKLLQFTLKISIDSVLYLLHVFLRVFTGTSNDANDVVYLVADVRLNCSVI